jgi:hypothetical protein
MMHEPFVPARVAARFVGFEVGDGPAGKDAGMRAFYQWVRENHVPKHHRGPRILVFRLSELEAAITATETPTAADETTALSRLEQLGRDHIRQAFFKGVVRKSSTR